MDLRLSDEYLALQAEVRAFIAKHGHLSPKVGGGRKKPDRKTLDWQKILVEHGYAGRTIPREYGGFGVPIITIDGSKPMFGPVVVPAPMGDDALRLWDVVLGYVSIPGLYEIKTPKTEGDLRAIGEFFTPYLTGRQWQTIQNPAP